MDDDIRRLLRKAARNLYRVIEDPEFWTPAFCQAFCEWCGEQAYEAPKSALVRGQIALELAAKAGDTHSMAKAHSIMASGYRVLSVYERGEEELKQAFEFARACPCCLSDINRCLGNLRLFQHRFDDAIICFDQASDYYRALDNEDGVGRALISRGIAHWRLGEIDRALADERRALQLLASDTPEFFYIAALTNTAHFLAKGEEKHLAVAEPFLDKVREQFAGMSGMTAARICLSWTHGLILARLGERKRGLQMLRKARTRLLKRRQDAEVVAITADISDLYCDTRRFRYIKELIHDCIENLRNVSDTRPLLENVLRAADRELDETRQRLAELRAAVTVSVPALNSCSSLDSIAAP